jgi:hypothetical protein
MSPWSVLLGSLLLWGGAASAQTLKGFSDSQRAYVVSPDEVCTPLVVSSEGVGGAATAGTASGTPRCSQAAADVLGRLSTRPPVVERGAGARFTATVRGRTLEVHSAAADRAVVTWTSLDPLVRVDAVYSNHFADLIAVALTVRAGGRDTGAIVGFDLGRAAPPVVPSPPVVPTPPVAPLPPVAPPPVAAPSPPLDRALKAARLALGRRAVAAWDKVLAFDPECSEALFSKARALLQRNKGEGGLLLLEKLATSTRPDAIEFLVQARFDRPFSSLRAEPRFRTAVGFDRPARTLYERIMGAGGAWEQAATSCDAPLVGLRFTRDRRFSLRVESRCVGERSEATYRGTWALEDKGVALALPDSGDDQLHCRLEAMGDEEALRCPLDDDLEFLALPVRR